MARILIEQDDFTTRITLHDPPLHILDIPMLEELRDALRQVSTSRPVLLIGASGDRVFSAGASVQDHLGDRVATMLQVFHDCFRILARLDVVTITLVKGAALGGGCELALGADFVLASDHARFGQPEINLGVFPPVAAYQLSRQLPSRKGLELLLTGNPISASDAAAHGLVNAVFPLAEFDERAEAWIAQLRKQSPTALRMTRRAFRMAGADEFEERLARVERFYLDELMKTDDAIEGLNAFIEKRPAVWKGR